ncbi:MAG: aminoglycoside phosphotransferase family protein, partial [Propionibacteriaceae bacterium]|nr:aminoglycoside phosphotransferase family protein [Propionibacteriaceae bacterium]
MSQPDPDGSILLTTDAVADLLVAAVQHAGGRLLGWQLDHVDSAPNHSTTATYYAEVEWPHGRRTELLGVSARVGAPTKTDSLAEIFADGDREVAVWIYPRDPDLPGLPRATYPEHLAALINARNLAGRLVTPA